MGLSIRAYAQHRGVSHTAVAKAIKAGRIGVESDGKIDPAKADAQWARNTLPSQNLNTNAGNPPANLRNPPVSTPGFHFRFPTGRFPRHWKTRVQCP
jgi:hypothetical protein